MNEMLDIKQAMEYLKMSKNSALSLAQKGKIKAYKPFNKWLFAKEDLDAFLKNSCNQKEVKRGKK